MFVKHFERVAYYNKILMSTENKQKKNNYKNMVRTQNLKTPDDLKLTILFHFWNQ